MRHIPLIFVFILIAYKLKAQENTKIETDSSIIETKYFEYLNSIREFNNLKSKDKIYFKDYNYSTKSVRQEGVFENGDATGIWNYYSIDGKLEKSINYNIGVKKLFTGKPEPYDDLFVTIKSKADKLLNSYFGTDFFQKNIQWDASNSYYYGSDYNSGRWFEIPDFKPETFLLRYYVIFDKERKYSIIEFNLDKNGILIRSDSGKTVGFKKCSSTCKFNITYAQSLDLAKANGLLLKNKYVFYLKWIEPSSKQSVEGDYEIIIAEFKSNTQVGNKTTSSFNAVAINPWTGKLKGKRDLQNITWSHPNSSSSSGLIEK